jgi:orotate phosphoribosyltransferase
MEKDGTSMFSVKDSSVKAISKLKSGNKRNYYFNVKQQNKYRGVSHKMLLD